eukprot:TRINITY_DN27510_c0_g1_i1.p1 TRINITY_DN27510_c0_g1~~TRINITY_DN27510_c0_g1_i1.p1  ORF type:complete len:496 (+),score=56.17 TRINITY_DN27510_c0_g1_i1:71-1558(+)
MIYGLVPSAGGRRAFCSATRLATACTSTFSRQGPARTIQHVLSASLGTRARLMPSVRSRHFPCVVGGAAAFYRPSNTLVRNFSVGSTGEMPVPPEGIMDVELGIEATVGVGATAGPERSLRPLEDAPMEVQNFSEVSKPDVIRDLCRANVPGWSTLADEHILVEQIMEGLSNQNFKVHLDMPEAQLRKYIPAVLFRAYGDGVGQIYDTETEFEIVKALTSYGILAKLYGHGEGWRIEGWLHATNLVCKSLKNPAIFLQIASSLGRMHKLANKLDFPKRIKSMDPWSVRRMAEWGNGCLRAKDLITSPEQVAFVADLGIEEMLAEREWLLEYMVADDPQISGSGLDVVFSHWDLQENNVLQTLHGLRLLDFEYSGMEHQAFDIATVFVECAIDYLHPVHPYFSVTLSDFPSEEEMRLFCSVYLSEYLESSVRSHDISVEVLIQRVRRFTLVNHLLWAMWAVIRAAQSPTYGKFDYLHYAHSRWFMYKWAKRAILHG